MTEQINVDTSQNLPNLLVNLLIRFLICTYRYFVHRTTLALENRQQSYQFNLARIPKNNTVLNGTGMK